MGRDEVTFFLACWGAIISTAVLVWDVYKWRKTGRPQLIVRASGNLQEARSSSKQKYISVKVTNNGDKPATLSLITYRYYREKPRKWRKVKPAGRGFFNKPIGATAELPFKLEVGAEWSCLVRQTEEIEKMVRDGYFYIEAENTSTLNSMKFPRTRLLLN